MDGLLLPDGPFYKPVFNSRESRAGPVRYGLDILHDYTDLWPCKATRDQVGLSDEQLDRAGESCVSQFQVGQVPW
jgi:hypothetical protein